MQNSLAAWFVILVALIAANLPFLNERVLLVFPLKKPKPLSWRLAELLVLYAATVGLGIAIEARLGQVQRQGWEFYAAFGSLFLTFAFPGFVWRYLRRRS
jgi:hypothetical protein